MTAARNGRVNTDGMTPWMLYRGWNKLAIQTGFAAARLAEMQEMARSKKDYDTADKIRDLVEPLTDAMDYLGLKYTEDQMGGGE